jgi:hypothetical protein
MATQYLGMRASACYSCTRDALVAFVIAGVQPSAGLYSVRTVASATVFSSRSF